MSLWKNLLQYVNICSCNKIIIPFIYFVFYYSLKYLLLSGFHDMIYRIYANLMRMVFGQMQYSKLGCALDSMAHQIRVPTNRLILCSATLCINPLLYKIWYLNLNKIIIPLIDSLYTNPLLYKIRFNKFLIPLMRITFADKQFFYYLKF